MNQKTKSLIRHIFTAIGTILTLIGLNEWIPIVDFLLENLDGIWNSIEVILGFVLTLIGFFQDRGERFVERETQG